MKRLTILKQMSMRIRGGSSVDFSMASYSKFHWRAFCAAPVEGRSTVQIPLAQTGEGIADCELLEWFVQEGDRIEEFQPLCQVQSDKATIDITSRYKGKVSKVHFSPGDVVKVGEMLLDVMADGHAQEESSSLESKAASEIETPRSRSRATLATPVVRSLAKDLGINLETVTGSGASGRILKDDLLKPASREEEDACISMPTTNGDEIIPIRGFMRTMAKTMTAAASVPHFHYMEEINMDALVKLKLALQPQASSKLTYLPFLIKALSLALTKYPLMNSTVNADVSELRRRACHNVGVAMATSCGLVVPNIKQVEKLSVFQISQEIYRLSSLASQNKLAPQDVKDGTITVSNFGAIGGKFGSPVLNLPEVAILAIGRIQKLPRFNTQGAVYPASIASVTLGADHRVIDGATVANFCNDWKSLVENPEQWI